MHFDISNRSLGEEDFDYDEVRDIDGITGSPFYPLDRRQGENSHCKSVRRSVIYSSVRPFLPV